MLVIDGLKENNIRNVGVIQLILNVSSCISSEASVLQCYPV
jgi:hypothetical protein